MSVLIESHYGPHYHTVTLQGRGARSAVWTKLTNLQRVQNHCLLCLQHVPTAVREKPVTLHYIWQSDANTNAEMLHKTIFTKKHRTSKNASNEMMQACVRASVFILLNILHTIESSGVGVFIKEMTDHNISLIGLNRNATTILQITPWWGKCN